MRTRELAGFLDSVLKLENFHDVSNNGLQIENRGEVRKICFGVDASLRGIQAAVDCGADCLVCHHGLSWGDSLKRITGMNYRLVSLAVQHDLAVYAAHLPLDAHPVYGNNAELCRILGVTRKRPAFEYHGQLIGFAGELRRAMEFSAFCDLVRRNITPDIQCLDFGPKKIRRIGVVSGGAGDMVEQAAELGLDAYFTGEPGLLGYTQAENWGVNVVFAGHYATETWGVKALCRLVQKQGFGVETEVLDFGIKY